jgi:hypothetical protein
VVVFDFHPYSIRGQRVVQRWAQSVQASSYTSIKLEIGSS